MDRQYRTLKEKYPDTVIFFRIGDFYKVFYKDAETCARVIGLTVSYRNKNSDNPIPLAGLPFHSIDSYLKKITRAGYKIAVCENVRDI